MRTSQLAFAVASVYGLAQAQECASGLHMIMARGTGEAPGAGIMRLLGERLVEIIDGSDFEALDYPADATDVSYVESVTMGSNAMREAVESYANDCPDTPIALFGYSQGAHLIGNAVCGNGVRWLNFTSDLPDQVYQTIVGSQSDREFEEVDLIAEDVIQNNVIAMILLGDPAHTANQTFNAGTVTTSDGIWPRDWSDCEDYNDKLRSYCDIGDVFCDPIATPILVSHANYTHTSGQDMVEFTIERWNDATGASVRVDAGGEFPTYEEWLAMNSNATATPTAPSPTSSSSPGVTGEPTPGAAAALTTGGLFVSIPMLLAAWLI